MSLSFQKQIGNLKLTKENPKKKPSDIILYKPYYYNITSQVQLQLFTKKPKMFCF